MQTGQAVQAALMGVDAASGKVWLSMRQVLPDPLQETLEALLAQGPPGDSSDSSGGRDGPGQSADAPIAAALPQEQEAMVCLDPEQCWLPCCWSESGCTWNSLKKKKKTFK